MGLESPRFDTITKNIYARIGSVAAVTKAGAVRWQVDAVSANAFDIDANGDVLVAGSQGSSCWLERHAADGAVKWTNRSSLDPVPCVRSLRIVPDGNVMLSADGRLSEMSATGAITPLARTPSATCFQCTVRTPFTLMRGDRAAALWSASGTQFTLVASRRDGSAAWERPKVGEFGVAAYGGGVLAQAVEAGTLCALGAAGNVRACFTPNAGSRRWGVGVAVAGNEVFALLAVASGNSA